MDLDKYFVKSELIPAVIQEHGTKKVLMLAYMNKESLAITLETGYTWFFSRSRQKLWNKGETSGHTQTPPHLQPVPQPFGYRDFGKPYLPTDVY